MSPCVRCIRMEELIVLAYTQRFPLREYVDPEQALAALLSPNEAQPDVPETGEGA